MSSLTNALHVSPLRILVAEKQPGCIGFCLGWRMKGGLGGWQGVKAGGK